jgi:CRP/FNR family transcriptional regulator, cyclic AMP receptor protein
MTASTAPLPLHVVAGLPARIRALSRVAPAWHGAGRMPDAFFGPTSQALLGLHGVVLVSAVRASGRVVALALLAPGDLWMGEPITSGDEGPALRVDALGRAAVALPEREALAAAAASASVATWLAETQLRRALAAERRAAHVLSLTVEERVRAAFAELARAGHATLEDGHIRLSARISQERLAWLAGTSRESANRVVASLVARGELGRALGRYVLPAGFSFPEGAS